MRKIESNKRGQKAITLIALIITIIIMLILVGVTVTITLGENGLLQTTRRAAELTDKAQIEERIQFEVAACYDYQNANSRVKIGKLAKNLGEIFEKEIIEGDIVIQTASNRSDYIMLVERVNEVKETNFPTTDLTEIQNFLDAYDELEKWTKTMGTELTEDLLKGKMQELGLYNYYKQDTVPEIYGGILDIEINEAMKYILDEGIVWIGYKENSYEIDKEGKLRDTTDSSTFAFKTGMITGRTGDSVNSIIGYTGNCPSKLVINDSNIKLIKTGVFTNCYNLRELVIENSEIEIQEYAFKNCPNLKTVTVNLAGLTEGKFSCGETGFSECNNLEQLNVKGISQADFDAYGLDAAMKGVFGQNITINVIQ